MISDQKVVHYIKKFYLLIILLAVAFTAVGGYWSSKLTLESDMAKLLPSDYESVKTLEAIKQQVGGQGNIRIVLESRDFTAMKTFADTLAKRFNSSPHFNFVDYKNDVAFYQKNALLLLEKEELDSLKSAIQQKIDSEKQKLNPFYVEDLFADEEEPEDGDLGKWEDRYRNKEPKAYYINADSTVMVVDVYPAGSNTSLDFVRSILGEVTRIVDDAGPQKYDPNMKVYYGGNIKSRMDEYEVVSRDLLGTGYVGFTGVFVLIIFYFRKLVASLLVSVTLIFSLAWTFGLTYLAIGNLNTITGFLIVILFGMGIEYGIHAMSRYMEGRKNGLSLEESMQTMVGPTARALATSAISTSASFYILLLMDFRGFSELGFISGTGIILSMLAMVVLLPAFIVLFEKFKLLKFKPPKSNSRPEVRRKFPFTRPVLLFSILMTLFAIYSLTQLRFEYDFTNLRAELPERKLAAEKISGIFDLSESPAIVLGNSKAEVDEIVASVKQIIKSDTTSPTVEAVRSAYSLVPDDQEEKLKTIAEIRRLVEEETAGILKGDDKERVDKLRTYLQVDKPFTLAGVPEKVKRQFTDTSGKIGNYAFIYPNVPLRDGKNAIEFRNDIGKITTASGKTFYSSSGNIIFADMLLIMLREGRIAVLLSFFVVFIIVYRDFRNLKETALILTPLILGLLWMIGGMIFFGLKINFFNMAVLPTIIGMSVDNGVHMYHRYKEEGRGSLLDVLRHTGMAIAMVTITQVVSYSSLILARHPGLNSIGDLAVIGISATFITAVVVLPAMLQLLENKKAHMKKEEIELIENSIQKQ